MGPENERGEDGDGDEGFVRKIRGDIRSLTGTVETQGKLAKQGRGKKVVKKIGGLPPRDGKLKTNIHAGKNRISIQKSDLQLVATDTFVLKIKVKTQLEH